MEAENVLEFVNRSPYLFRDYLRNGVVFNFEVNGEKMDFSRNKINRGLDAVCDNFRANFHWDSEKKAWVP